MSKKRPWPERWLDCFFPPSCPGCGSDGYGFCPQCRATITPVVRQLGEGLVVYGGGDYQGPLRHGLLQAKKLGYTYLVYALADIMLSALPPHLCQAFPVAVVPMPAAKSRLRQRGYSIPFLLARELCRQRDGFILRTDLLRLRRETGEQKPLSRAERFENVRGAYGVPEGAARELYVLLIDDVLTTGASAREASRALYEQGAMRVDVVVLGIRG